MPQYRLSIRAEAEMDIAEAYAWCEEQAQLGGALIAAVDERLLQLLAQPFACTLIAHDIRRAVVQRFPYNMSWMTAWIFLPCGKDAEIRSTG